MKRISLQAFGALFFIGLLTCIYFGFSYGHAILIWKQFDQSFHGHWHSTPLWYENQVDQALHWLILSVNITSAAGVTWVGIRRSSKAFGALFFIGLLACIYFVFSYGHAILIWKQFDQSFHGHSHPTPLWYEKQVVRALHWLIVTFIITCAAGVTWIGIRRSSNRVKST